jgi:RHS repeat-associated protein
VVENDRGQWITHESSTGSVSYTYDRIGRLTTATDRIARGGTCTSRVYGFDLVGNRTQSGTVTTSAGEPCSAAALEPTATYDSAERLVSTSGEDGNAWTYDALGRTTTMPTAGGIVTNSYYTNDQIASQTLPETARASWGLDPQNRRTTNVQETWLDGAWSESATKVTHYADDTDEASWIAEEHGDETSVSRFISGVDNELAITTDADGGRVLQLVDLHRDIVGTIPIADDESEATWSELVLRRYDEFGNTIALGPSAADATYPPRYGWVGAAQRSAEALGGAILMGARVYMPSIGRFLTVDPVPGGTETTYGYPQDPINLFDLDGRGFWSKLGNVLGKAAKVAAVVGFGACIVATAGVCTGIALAGAAISVGARVSSKIGGDGSSWASVIGKSAADLILARIPGVRKGIQLVGRHVAERFVPRVASTVLRAAQHRAAGLGTRGAVTYALRSTRAAFSLHPVRSSWRAGRSAAALGWSLFG